PCRKRRRPDVTGCPVLTDRRHLPYRHGLDRSLPSLDLDAAERRRLAAARTDDLGAVALVRFVADRFVHWHRYDLLWLVPDYAGDGGQEHTRTAGMKVYSISRERTEP